MFLDIFIEILLFGIIIGISYYGYQKGIFGLVTKPIKTVAAFAFATVGYDLLKHERLYDFLLPLLPMKGQRLFVDLFVLRYVLNGSVFVLLFFTLRSALGLMIKLLNSFLSVGIIGWVNKVFGLFAASGISLIFANVFAKSVDWLFDLEGFKRSELVSDFNGGLLYSLFDNLS
jgi:hypothetical protein